MCNAINESIEQYYIIFIDATVAITTHSILVINAIVAITTYNILVINTIIAITTHNILIKNAIVAITTHNILVSLCYFAVVQKVIIHATSNEPRPLIVLLETNLFETVVNGVLVDLISK